MTVSRLSPAQSNQLLILVQEPRTAKLHEFYQVFSGIGDVQQIDFSYYSMFSVILLTYFDVRIAEQAKTLLEEISSLRVCQHNSSTVTSRSLVFSGLQLQKIEASCGVASYGDIECVKDLDDGRVLVSYYDSRAAQKAMVDVDPLGRSFELDETHLTQQNVEAASNTSQMEIGMLLKRLESQNTTPQTSNTDGNMMGDGANQWEGRRYPQETRPDSMSPGFNSLEDALPDAFFESDHSGMPGGSLQKLPPGFMPSECEVNPRAILQGLDWRTTIMARHLPNSLTQESLVSLLHTEGLKGKFDLVYLPIDRRTKCNVGYVFINMVNPQAVVDLYERFHLKRWNQYNSTKVCEVMYAKIQGRETLKEELHRRQADARAGRRPVDAGNFSSGTFLSGPGSGKNLSAPSSSMSGRNISGLSGSPPQSGKCYSATTLASSNSSNPMLGGVGDLPSSKGNFGSNQSSRAGPWKDSVSNACSTDAGHYHSEIDADSAFDVGSLEGRGGSFDLHLVRGTGGSFCQDPIPLQAYDQQTQQAIAMRRSHYENVQHKEHMIDMSYFFEDDSVDNIPN
jgi:hypothetical protein